MAAFAAASVVAGPSAAASTTAEIYGALAKAIDVGPCPAGSFEDATVLHGRCDLGRLAGIPREGRQQAWSAARLQ